MAFNVIEFLDDHHVRYSSTGKNTSRGWVNLQCLFCWDKSNHLGINLSNGSYNCWVCGKSGNAFSLIEAITGTHGRDVSHIFKKYSDPDSFYIPPVRKQTIKPPEEILPFGYTKQIPTSYLQYLEKRGYDPWKIVQLYDLAAVLNVGDYKYRFIIPIYLENRLQTFVARDVTGKSKIPYLNCPDSQSSRPVKSCLYNLDLVRDDIIILEGCPDVWRMGGGSVATLGIAWTKEQIALLAGRGIKRAYVMFDNEDEAQEQGIELAKNLAGLIPYVESIDIQEFHVKDPGQLTDDQAYHLKKELFS